MVSRGLGNRGRQHDLAALFGGLNGRALGREIHRAIKCVKVTATGHSPFQRGFAAADFTLAGQEDQDPALGFSQSSQN